MGDSPYSGSKPTVLKYLYRRNRSLPQAFKVAVLTGNYRPIPVTDLSRFEVEVQTKSGNWYRMAILVHRTDEHVIEGIVLTFINIDMQKNAQRAYKNNL